MIIKQPIEDWIDLHTFRPDEVSMLLADYFEECLAKGIHEVRVIHGKGTGRLKAKVLSFLQKSPLAASYYPAPPERGGWGATIVTIAVQRPD